MSFICADCVNEPCLRQLVQDAAIFGTPCEYCDDDLPAADLWTVARLCHEVLDIFFEVSSNTMAVVHFDRTPAGDDLPTTITQLTGMPQEAVEVIVDHLESLWYDIDSGESIHGDDEPWFVRKPSMAKPLGEAWRKMEESLHSDVRYFNPQALELLNTIFGEVSNDRDKEGRPVITEAGGVSGFLCVRSHLAHFNASSQVRREALGEQNGELVFRGTPSDGWHFPIFRDVAQG